MRRTLLLASICVLACDSGLWPESKDVLWVRMEATDLVVTNRGPGEVVDVTLLAKDVPAANWALCSGGPNCIGRPSGATWRRPLTQFRNYEAGDEIVIFWNQLAPLPNGDRRLVRSGRSSIRP